MILPRTQILLAFDVHVSMMVLPKPMMMRPVMTRVNESRLDPAADIVAPRKIAVEHASEPLQASDQLVMSNRPH